MSNVIEPIDKVIGQFIKDKKMYVLRDKATGRALNTSYSEDGLKWSTSANGRLIYYKNAIISREWKKDYGTGEWTVGSVSITGDLTPNPDVYVEQFVPTNHSNIRQQIAEYTVVSKAYRLLYHTQS